MALTAAMKLTHPPKWVMDILGGFDNDTLERAEKIAQENNCKIELIINPRSFSDMDDSVKVYIWKGNDCYYINEDCKIELTIAPRSFSDMDDSVKVYIWKGNDRYYINEDCKIELTIAPRSFSDMDDSVKVYIWKGNDRYYINEETHKDGSKMVTYMHDIKIKDENGDVMSLESADMQFGDGVRFTRMAS